MTKLNKSALVRLSVDIVLTAALLLLALNFYSIFKYRVKRGFFCNDESLKYPFQTDSMGGKSALLFMSLYMPAIVIVLGESILYLLKRTRETLTKNAITATAFLQLHCNLTTFVCGFALHALFVHVVKIFMGRLRPHFFEVCQPYRSLDGSTCDNPKNHGIYIQDYECNGRSDPNISQQMLNDIYVSFPSGHASFMFYGMIFIVLYLQRMANALRQYQINVGLFMFVLQMFCVLLAWFVAVSRVMDYKHHWSDVLVGIVLGASVAIAASLFAHQQLKSVNNWPEGVKSSSSSSSETSYTATSATTLPNAILVS